MPSASEHRARVLLAILVYNGRAFVPACLESAARVGKGSCEVDVLVLDDCSPDEGWSDELAELCAATGIGYYCSPRNLGIPRNMNLGLLRAVEAGYDYVVILNSDVVLPSNLADVLVGVAEANERVGSVTAWSNNCSIYSLPNDNPDDNLGSQEMVDWLSEMLGGEFGPAGVDIPAAVGFCMMIPTETVRAVGLYDPVFGRGYCEELDWCLRAKSMGYRNLLATNGFVYHMGSGSTREAGLLSAGETTVDAHEKVIDWRYPLFRGQVGAFLSSDIPSRMVDLGLRRIVVGAAREWGYELRTGATALASDAAQVIFRVREQADGAALSGYFRGFETTIKLEKGAPLLETLRDLTGREPDRIVMRGATPFDGAVLDEAAAGDVSVSRSLAYPEKI